MRVLIYSHAFLPKVGGTETVVMLLAQGLARHAGLSSRMPLEITVVTPTPAEGVNDSDLPFRVVRQPSLMALVRLLRWADIIHLAGPVLVPMIVGLLLRKPIVIEHHGFQAVCPNGQLLYNPTQTLCPGHFMAKRYRECVRCNRAHGILQSLKMWLLTFPRRWLCQRASTNILPTEWLTTVLQLQHTVTIHHGLVPLKSRRDGHYAPTVPTFAFMGRLVSSKGARVLLEAAHQLKAKGYVFQIKIIGEGPERDALEMLALGLQIRDRIDFLGHVSSEQSQQSLSDTAAVVVPSLAGEVFGLVVVENMLHGKTLIVSDMGSLREVVGDTALIFPAGDVSALAHCMQQVMERPDLAASLGSAARARAMQLFNQDSMIERHISLYDQLLCS
jgi:glycogen synthase